MREVDDGKSQRHEALRVGRMLRSTPAAPWIAATLCVLTTTFMMSCSAEPSSRNQTVAVAVVDGRPIDSAAFLHQLRAEMSLRGQRGDSAEAPASALASEVQLRMVDDELIRTQLDRQSVRITEVEVLSAVALRARQFRSEAEFRAHVGTHFGGRLAFHADTRRLVLRSRLMELVSPAPDIDDAAVRRYYDDHPSEFANDDAAAQAQPARTRPTQLRPSSRSFEEVSHEIRASLSRRGQYAAWRAVLEKLRSDARIELHVIPAIAPAAEVQS